MTSQQNPFHLSRRAMIGGGAALGASLAFPGPALLAAEGERWANLHKMASDYVAQDKVANMIAYIGFGSGAALVGAGRDTMGGARKSDADSLYRLYSMTKPITGMAVMILIDEGKLGLDQPVAEILPAFANMQVQKTYDGSIGPENLEPAVRPITIRQILTHTAGLPYSIVQQGPVAKRMTELGIVSGQVSKIPVPGFDRGKPVGSLAEFADLLATMPLVYQPATKWSYSTGLDLAGRVIEVVSGKSFDAFLKERIFEPCGMTSTWFQVPKSEVGRLTTNYGVVGGSLIPLDPPQSSIYLEKPAFPFGGSGLVGSPRDYDRFLRMIGGYGLLDGKRVMSEAAVRMGTSDLLPNAETVKGTSVEGYGFGAGGRMGGRDGNNFGWAGAAGTFGFVEMGSGLRSTLYTQFMPGSAYPLQEDFLKAVRADLAAMRGAG